jgi:hypothetical protein
MGMRAAMEQEFRESTLAAAEFPSSVFLVVLMTLDIKFGWQEESLDYGSCYGGISPLAVPHSTWVHRDQP